MSAGVSCLVQSKDGFVQQTHLAAATLFITLWLLHAHTCAASLVSLRYGSLTSRQRRMQCFPGQCLGHSRHACALVCQQELGTCRQLHITALAAPAGLLTQCQQPPYLKGFLCCSDHESSECCEAASQSVDLIIVCAINVPEPLGSSASFGALSLPWPSRLA